MFLTLTCLTLLLGHNLCKPFDKHHFRAIAKFCNLQPQYGMGSDYLQAARTLDVFSIYLY